MWLLDLFGPKNTTNIISKKKQGLEVFTEDSYEQMHYDMYKGFMVEVPCGIFEIRFYYNGVLICRDVFYSSMNESARKDGKFPAFLLRSGMEDWEYETYPAPDINYLFDNGVPIGTIKLFLDLGYAIASTLYAEKYMEGDRSYGFHPYAFKPLPFDPEARVAAAKKALEEHLEQELAKEIMPVVKKWKKEYCSKPIPAKYQIHKKW